jgi:hypothetical protein
VARITQCNAVICGKIFVAVRFRDNLVNDNRSPATPNTATAEDLQDLVVKQIVLMITRNVYAIEIKQGLPEGFQPIFAFLATASLLAVFTVGKIKKAV